MRAKLPSLRALKAFEATARAGSLTRAAEELSVTHGAVSRQVRALEDELGHRLFDRTAHGMTLTRAGTHLFAASHAAFGMIEGAVETLRPARAMRHLRVSCLGTLAMRWLIPRLGRFPKQASERILLEESYAPLDAEQAPFDIAVRVGKPPWPQGFEITPLFEDCTGPVCTPASLAAPDDIDALLSLPRLHTKTRLSAWQDWLQATGRGGPNRAQPGSTFDHFFYLIEALLAGEGAAVVPQIFVADLIEEGRLVAPCGFVANGLTYFAAIPASSKLRLARRFATWLAELSADQSRSD